MARLTALAVLFVIAMSFESWAADTAYMRGRMYQRQQQAIDGLISCFKSGADPESYKDHVINLVSAETNLLAFGESPKSPNLVGRFAADIKSQVEYPVFAYRLLRFQMQQQSGFTPNVDNTFKAQVFRVTSKTDPSRGEAVVSINNLK